MSTQAHSTVKKSMYAAFVSYEDALIIRSELASDEETARMHSSSGIARCRLSGSQLHPAAEPLSIKLSPGKLSVKGPR